MEKVPQMRMRFQPTGLAVREKEGEAENRIIEGCAIVFNAETTLWDGKYVREREVIAREAITPEFLAEQDIKLNLLHERNDTIARNNKGVGTLELDLREDGLYFSVELPKCDLGDRALELIRNKTYTGCSFEFMPKTWSEEKQILPDGREDTLYTITGFEFVSALTIAMDPAYEQTCVSELRETYKKQEEQIREDREADEAAEKAKQEAKLRKFQQMGREIDLLELES